MIDLNDPWLTLAQDDIDSILINPKFDFEEMINTLAWDSVMNPKPLKQKGKQKELVPTKEDLERIKQEVQNYKSDYNNYSPELKKLLESLEEDDNDRFWEK